MTKKATMRKLVFAILILTVPCLSFSTTSREMPNSAQMIVPTFRIKDIEKTLGKKLSLKERLAIFIARPRLKRAARESKQSGNVALIFGISGAAALVIGIFVGPILIVALVAAIVAIILGSNAKKKILLTQKLVLRRYWAGSHSAF